jgi:hypothetical protein
VHRSPHQRQQQGEQSLGPESGSDHDSGALFRRRDPPLALRIQAPGTSDGRPRHRPLEPDIPGDCRVALDPLRTEPGAVADRARRELLDPPGPRVPLGLLGDVGSGSRRRPRATGRSRLRSLARGCTSADHDPNRWLPEREHASGRPGEHRATARTGYAPPPPNGRSIAARMPSDPSRLAVASWAVSFAWRTTGDGSLAMVLLDGTYAAAATAAERAPFAAGAEVLIALNDGRDRVPQALGILSDSLLIPGRFRRGLRGWAWRPARSGPSRRCSRPCSAGHTCPARAAARLADRHRLCALGARGPGTAQPPTGGCRSDRTCATAGWTPQPSADALGHRASPCITSSGLRWARACYPRAAADGPGARAAAGPVAARRASVTIVVWPFL